MYIEYITAVVLPRELVGSPGAEATHNVVPPLLFWRRREERGEVSFPGLGPISDQPPSRKPLLLLPEMYFLPVRFRQIWAGSSVTKNPTSSYMCLSS